MIKDTMKLNELIGPNDREVEKLKQNFPSCFDNNGTFDVKKLENPLLDKIDLSKEGYELNFLGKNYAKLLSSLDTITVIKPDEEHNNKPENINSQNVYMIVTQKVSLYRN